jgi:hypothetical protein
MKIGTIRIQIGKNCWDLETCRKVRKKWGVFKDKKKFSCLIKQQTINEIIRSPTLADAKTIIVVRSLASRNSNGPSFRSYIYGTV